MLESIQNDFKEAVAGVAPEMTATQKTQTVLWLDKAQTFLCLVTIFILPFVFLPLTLDWFDQAKVLFLGIMVAAIGLATLAKTLLSPNQTLVTTVIDKILLAIIAVLVVSSWLSPNRINAALGEPIQWLYIIALFFLLINVLKKQETWIMAFNVLTWSVAVLGLWQAAQTFLTLASRVITPLTGLLTKFPAIAGFLPVGTPFTLAWLLLLSLPLVLGKYLAESSNQKKAAPATLLLVILTFIGLAGVAFTLFNNRPILMDADTGRRIATGTLGKSYQAALFGVGPNEYVSAFTQYRGLDFNNSAYWNFNFTTANSFVFYVLTIGGLALLVAFVLIALQVYSMGRKRTSSGVAGQTEKGLFASLALSAIGMIFFPMPYLALWFTFMVLALLFSWYRLQEIGSLVRPLKLGKSAQAALLAIGLVVVVVSLYATGLSFAADMTFRSSLEAAAKNQGVNTYNAQVRASQMAPWKDNYRVALSQTNLALADSLASQKGLTDQQKQTVVQLVQQSILEARNAVALSPNNAVDWQNLALIYRNLINFAQGADQWTVLTENQAINLDPANPRLRLDLGGVYYAQGDWNNAAQQFANAAQLKPDYANAHYNLAQAFKQVKLNDQALQQLQLTAQLVCPRATNKSDCDRVNSEINDLTKLQTANLGGNVAGAATPSSTPSVKANTLSQPLASPAAEENANLPKAKTQPPVKVTSPSGELAQ